MAAGCLRAPMQLIMPAHSVEYLYMLSTVNIHVICIQALDKLRDAYFTKKTHHAHVVPCDIV